MQKPAPVYTLDFVLHPERDGAYQHFENASANPFQPNPTDFPRVNVWWLAEAALLTYWDPAEAIPIFEAAGFECEFISAGGTDCYVAVQTDFVVVAFRGTQPDKWKDIIADANILLAPWQTGMVHGLQESIRRHPSQARYDPCALGPRSNAVVLRTQPRGRARHAGGRPLRGDPWRLHIGVT